MLKRRIEKLEGLLDKLPFDPQRWRAQHVNDTPAELQAALAALTEAELEIACADHPPWMQSLNYEQLTAFIESGGNISAIWETLTTEQREMIQLEERECAAR